MMSAKFFLPLFLLPATAVFAQNMPVNPDLLQNYWQACWIAHPTAPAAQYGIFHFRKTPAGGLSAEIDLPYGINGTMQWKGKEVALNGGKQRLEF